MYVKTEQLSDQLTKLSLPVIWISGDETLLVQESCDEVRQQAKALGFLEREVFEVNPQFDWNLLLESSNSLSLFAEKKLIDLRINASKLDNQAKKALQSYISNPSPDNLLMITSGKIEKASTKAKWFQAIEKKSYFVQIWPINAQQLPNWIEQRLKRKGFTADSQAIMLLTQRVEGNLLAAAQEIEKLRMLTDATHLDAQTVAGSVADSSRYSVFSLMDCILQGNSTRGLRIIHHLKAEGTEPLQILNILCRELRALISMRTKVEAGQLPNAVMQAERVWSSRTQIVGTALTNHTVSGLQAILYESKKIDQSVKGLLKANPWNDLTHLLLKLANTHTCLSSL